MPFDAEAFDYTTVDPLTLTEPRQRLEYMRDFLRGLPPERFDMGSSDAPKDARDCGTPACIAGWSIAVFERPYAPFATMGAELFDVPDTVAHRLFFPCGGSRGWLLSVSGHATPSRRRHRPPAEDRRGRLERSGVTLTPARIALAVLIANEIRGLIVVAAILGGFL